MELPNKGVIFSVFSSSLAAIMRRTAVCDHYILTSGRIWAGGGSISLKGTTLTSAPVPVLTYAVLTPPIARWDKKQHLIIKLIKLLGKYVANPHLPLCSSFHSCWACTTRWTPKHPPHPAVFLRTWSPSPSSTTWVAPLKSSSSPTWWSSPASAARPFQGPARDMGCNGSQHYSGAGMRG